MARWRFNARMDRIADGEVECDTELEAMEYARNYVQGGIPDYELNVELIEEEDEDSDDD